MRILLLGGTGNLGSRLIPALLAHGHVVVCYVRSPPKLQSIVSADLLAHVTVYEGDALDPQILTTALLEHECDGIINAAHNYINRPGASVSADHLSRYVAIAAVEAGRARGRALRAWFIGGLGSLEYPNTGGWRIEDYMPLFMTQNHRETERILKAIPPSELGWTLLCVAFMVPEHDEQGSVQELSNLRGHSLVLATNTPPNWVDHWIRRVPFLGVYINLFLAIKSYTTQLEGVADMIAEQFEEDHCEEYLRKLVGMKELIKNKNA